MDACEPPVNEGNNTGPAEETRAEPGREQISAFIVCYNEEDQIADCLESLTFCDEIVAIDSFSTDSTVEICRSYGAKVIQHPWPGYRQQKAFGLSRTMNEWVINLDADERVSPELRENILVVLKEDYERKRAGVRSDPKDEVNGYAINRVVYFLGRWWRRGGWYPEYRVRFFRKSKVIWGGVDPHEKPIVEGKTKRLDGEILHYTYKNMDEQLSRLQNFSSIAAVEEFKRGKRATVGQLLLNPLLRSFKFYVVKKGYREGVAGLIVSIIEGYYTFMKYAKLWEYQLNPRQGREIEDDGNEHKS